MLASHVDASILEDVRKKLSSMFSKPFQAYIRGVNSLVLAPDFLYIVRTMQTKKITRSSTKMQLES